MRLLTLLLLLIMTSAGCAKTVRFATFNASLNRDKEGQLVADLSTPGNVQAGKVASIIQTVRPDILLINEFDYDDSGRAAALFQQNYLAVSRDGSKPIAYNYVYVAPTNTGVPSSLDLNNDGTVNTTPGTRGYGEDCLGFGAFPGQFGFVIFSKYPIHHDRIRTWQKFLWKDLPDTRMPRDFYTAAAQDVLPLSSKNHVSVPIDVNGKTIYVLAAHPTPPVFDGPEDRNGFRNADEIKLLTVMIDKLTMAEPVGPPPGQFTGKMPAAVTYPFVVMGDLNADPRDGDSRDSAIHQLLNHPRVNSTIIPESPGAIADAKTQAGPNDSHQTESRHDTSDFSERGSGNLRVDYVLPSADLTTKSAGVFWPAPNDPGRDLIDCTDHRLVWIDIVVK
jgi:hypothetical protein